MKILRIDYLAYENFMGAAKQRWDFHGQSARILGGNGTGKTTAYHAFTWLLFGKDCHGNKEFDLKPHGADGAVLDRGAVTSVEAGLTVDGVPCTLKRTYFELWTTRRGSTAEKFDGHSSEFFIDGVPALKKEFDARVREIADEELFRALTDVRAFAEGLDWRKRRELLLALCALPGDLEMMRAAPDGRFDALAERCAAIGPDKYKKTLLARRKELNGAQTSVPARLDEQQKNVAALAGTDFAALRQDWTRLETEAEAIRGDLAMLTHDALRTEKRQALATVENAIRELENRNEAHRLEQRRSRPAEADRRPELKAAVDGALRESAALADRIHEAQELIPGYEERARAITSNLEAQLTALRGRWNDCARQLDALPDPDAGGDWEYCPTCGQAWPAARMESERARFRETLSARRAALETRSREIEAEAGQAKAYAAEQTARQERLAEDERNRLESLLARKRESDTRMAEARAALDAYVPPEPAVIDDLPEYGERRTELEAEAAELRASLAELEGSGAEQREALSRRLAAVSAERERVGRSLAMEAQLDFARQRCEELREEARRVTEEIEDLDHMLALCEEFTRYKVRFVEDRVNGNFRTVRFRLFAEQVNGGLADCCDVLVSGSRFGRGANTGGEMAAGLEIIGALSRHFGLSVPVFIDQCESVEKLPDTDTQVICLEVDKRDRALRCELAAQAQTPAAEPEGGAAKGYAA